MFIVLSLLFCHPCICYAKICLSLFDFFVFFLACVVIVFSFCFVVVDWSMNICFPCDAVANTCTCTGGAAAVATDGSCEVNNAEDCTACGDGYTLNGQVCGGM